MDRIFARCFHPLTLVACRVLGYTNFQLAKRLICIGVSGGMVYELVFKRGFFAAFTAAWWFWMGWSRLKAVAAVERHQPADGGARTLTSEEVSLRFVRTLWVIFLVIFFTTDSLDHRSLVWDCAMVPLVWGMYAATDYNATGKSVWAWLWEHRPSFNLGLRPAPTF